ncbi:hypothetical protein [Streptomyces roseochromogenus]|uniref:Uncharacterized protein n=1 Tax=Streptomyces roseochromogenus subsp. oscitans DS 12.976 TaxID=1352936 RepID=V6KGD1_STRRC|nr:hypothetical protein [Streptomyces roseochromogenus]EST28059.1 hypothetical protein M878_23595 [Streptomyces roseochromogenus subsp. oscitans DS 12.976]
MRTRTVLAAIALTGTVLLGGAAQALADNNDGMGDLMGSGGNVMGNTGNAMGNMGNSGGDFGSASHGKSDFGPKTSGFGHVGGIFDKAVGN